MLTLPISATKQTHLTLSSCCYNEVLIINFGKIYTLIAFITIALLTKNVDKERIWDVFLMMELETLFSSCSVSYKLIIYTLPMV